ncbi:hypothetical protein RRF57_005964 [Xylaria bambusicola]|uniref:Uncharacterized protein n=1 Tax=Xylaria bambusicola TaxID=326684 RepID=A0AAN7UMZ9_9PEZI
MYSNGQRDPARPFLPPPPPLTMSSQGQLPHITGIPPPPPRYPLAPATINGVLLPPPPGPPPNSALGPFAAVARKLGPSLRWARWLHAHPAHRRTRRVQPEASPSNFESRIVAYPPAASTDIGSPREV